MSENDTPRDELGRFASLSDHYASEHARLEFEPMADDRPREEDRAPIYSGSNSDDNVRQAAAELQERRGVQVEDAEEVVWHDRHGDRLPENISTTKDQASAALNAYRQAKAEAAAAAEDRELRAAIDNPRVEMAVLDPETAAKYEFKHEIDRAVHEFAAEMGVETPAVNAAPEQQPARENVHGLDPEVERALQHPQIRAAVESELAQAHQAKADYEAKVNEANAWAQASLVHQFPELGRLPVEQWENALMTVQAQDPVRFQKGVGVINQVQRVSAEQARIQNEKAVRAQQAESARQQQIEQWSRAEGDRYNQWAAKEGLDLNSFAPAVGRYIETNLGLSRDQLFGFGGSGRRNISR